MDPRRRTLGAPGLRCDHGRDGRPLLGARYERLLAQLRRGAFGAFDAAADRAREVLAISSEWTDRAVDRVARYNDEETLEQWREWIADTERWSETRQDYALLVDKAARRLHLYFAGEVIKTFRVDLGLDPVALRGYLDTIAERRGGVTVNAQTGRRLAAVVPMHAFGHPVDVDALAEVARDFEITVVEDAAEALGSTLAGRPCGSLARIAALSFNGNKILTTGGGGAVFERSYGMPSPPPRSRRRILWPSARSVSVNSPTLV